MDTLIQSIIDNCTKSELLNDPDCWNFLEEFKGKCDGDDAAQVGAALEEMRVKRNAASRLRVLHQLGAFYSETVDNAFFGWLEENCCFNVKRTAFPDGRGWYVDFCCLSHESFNDLLNACTTIAEKFEEFGGEYGGWSFM